MQHLALRPLSIDAVRCLGDVSAEEAAEIVRATAENPFFVTEVLATHNIGFPATVRDAVLAPVGRLPLVRRLLRPR